MALAALVPDIHKELGAFIALIVVNCIILGRQEAFASKNPVGRSVLDAAGNGIGFMITLLLMGGIREVLGYGTFLGVPLFGPHYEPWVIMILPPGGFLTLGVIMLVLSLIERRRKRRAEAAAADGTRRAA
jgi:electron transport complex protein RnfE